MATARALAQGRMTHQPARMMRGYNAIKTLEISIIYTIENELKSTLKSVKCLRFKKGSRGLSDTLPWTFDTFLVFLEIFSLFEVF